MKKIQSTLIISLLFSSFCFAQSRNIVNGGFENPAFAIGTVLFQGAQNDPNPGVPGWYTTNGAYNGFAHPIELWSTGYSGVNAAPGQGNQFAEINCSENARMYQTICLVQGESFDWSFFHRGRAGNDIGEFSIYNAAGTSKLQVLEAMSDAQAWKNYTGTSTFTGATGTYQLSFEALSTATDNPAVGNFLDGVSIVFHPMVEFLQTNYSGIEHLGNNLPRIRIKGTVPAGGMNLTFAITGGTATPGDDYSINTNLFIPAGDYNGTLACALTLPLTIFDDDLIESDETVVITITAADAGGQLLDAGCDGQTILTTTYKIGNDDICITPFIKTAMQIPMCEGDTALLHVTDINNLQWSTGETTTTILVTEPGKYSVVSFDHNCLVKDSIVIETKVCDCEVKVPTAFSPNGDGMNDLFRPLNSHLCKLDEMQLNVFDRWGNLVYATDDILKPWDGTFKGSPAPVGVYLWTLEYKVHGENSIVNSGTQTGNVTLLK